MRPTLRVAVLVYALAVLVVLASASATALADPSGVRELLNLDPPPPAGLRDLAAILARNVPLAIAVLLLGRGVESGLPKRLADGWLLTVTTVNVVMAGAAVGAYGTGLGLRFAIYAPIELAAFSLAASAYVTQRWQGRTSGPGIAMLTIVLLLVAGSVESFLPPLT